MKRNPSVLQICCALTMAFGLLERPGLADPPSPVAAAPDLRPASLGTGPAWDETQKSEQRKAALALLERLKEALASSTNQFVIPPGDYRFDGEAGKDFKLTNVKGLSIDAEGATFWFHPRYGVHLENCSDVTLKGLTVDADPLPWEQGTIEKIDPGKKTVDLAMEPGFEAPDSAAFATQWRTIFFDRTTGRRLQVGDDYVVKCQGLDSRHLKISQFASNRMFLDPVFPRPVEPGDRIALLDPRLSHANVEMIGCDNVTLQSVCVYGGAGFGYHEREGKGGNHYLGCRLVRRPQTNRLMASRMDGLHSYLMAKGPHIENCELSFAGDDLVAIHGFFGLVLESGTAGDLLVGAPFSNNLFPGSKVKFYHIPNADSAGEATVLTAEVVKDPAKTAAARAIPQQLKTERQISIRPMEGIELVRVTLDRPVSLGTYDFISSESLCGEGAVVRGNYLHDGNIRGVLAKTKNLTVENNVIERLGHGGIVIEAELFWLEGPFSEGVKITHNRITDAGWSGLDRVGMTNSLAGIQIGQHFGKRLFPRTFVTGEQNRDIQITDNEIQTPAGFGIIATNTQNLVITGNRIVHPFAAGPNPAYYSGVHFEFPATPSIADKKKLYTSIYIQAVRDGKVASNPTLQAPAFLSSPVTAGPETVNVTVAP